MMGTKNDEAEIVRGVINPNDGGTLVNSPSNTSANTK